MRFAIIASIYLVSVAYVLIALVVFAMHTQMPATLGLALMRSLFWPVWICGGLQGTPLPMD
jgi:hypothetical protein